MKSEAAHAKTQNVLAAFATGAATSKTTRHRATAILLGKPIFVFSFNHERYLGDSPGAIPLSRDSIFVIGVTVSFIA